MTSTPEQVIARIREALEAGPTPGPWRHHVPDRGYCIDYIVTDAPEAKSTDRFSDLVAETGNSSGPRGVGFFEKDAAFIAACNPQNIAVLLAERDALRKALAPFIVHYEPWMDRWPDDAETSTFPRHTFGDIRRARTLLAGDNHG